jgi:hypothetical protein
MKIQRQHRHFFGATTREEEEIIHAFLMHKYCDKKWSWGKTIVKLHGNRGISKRCHQSGA